MVPSGQVWVGLTNPWRKSCQGAACFSGPGLLRWVQNGDNFTANMATFPMGLDLTNNRTFLSINWSGDVSVNHTKL